MKSILTKALALICVALLVLSLAACDGNDKKDESSATVAAADQTATADNQTEAAAAATEAAAAADKGIVGTWEFEYGSFTYTFNADGTGVYEIFDDVMNFTYEVTDTTVSILYEGSSDPIVLEYELSGDVLNIKDSAGDDTIYNRK